MEIVEESVVDTEGVLSNTGGGNSLTDGLNDLTGGNILNFLFGLTSTDIGRTFSFAIDVVNDARRIGGVEGVSIVSSS